MFPLGNLEKSAVSLRQGPHRRLFQITQGEQRPGKLLLRQPAEKVALVLGTVRPPAEQVTAGGRILSELGVVAGGQIVRPQLLGSVPHGAELDPPVAEYAGIRRAAHLVFPDEIVDDRCPKFRGEVHIVEGKPQQGCHGPGVGAVIRKAVCR